MRHATQARFDHWNAKMSAVSPRAGAYPLSVMEQWRETEDWNWHIRYALQAQGYRTFHIREASETGVADLIVYRQVLDVDGLGVSHGNFQVIDAWLELKKDNDRGQIRPAQKEFMREHWRNGHNALFVMFDRQVGMLTVHQGDLKGRVKMYPPCPYSLDWANVFAHFKARK